MSHRLALALSIALTLVLAATIFAGRDRLFEAAAGAGPATVTPAPAKPLDDAVSESHVSVAGVAPQVIEIPLPGMDQQSTLSQEDADQRSRGRDDDRDWGDDDDEHEADHEDGEHEEEADD
jgi:hypothetical protein